jgi:hypothetical protein
VPPDRGGYPPSTHYVDMARVGFRAPEVGDYRLAPKSPYLGIAPGGGVVGARIEEISDALGELRDVALPATR